MESFNVTQLFCVEGLVCVVTGGATGIGFCFVRQMEVLMVDISSALAQNGATVYIVGRRKEKLDSAVKLHQSVYIPGLISLQSKGKMIPMVGDVNSKDDLKRIAEHIEAEHGYINLLSTPPHLHLT
jgi:NAD(P)-dependent dehydrogenase (short-subunit alcohol dehydrogenase family)